MNSNHIKALDGLKGIGACIIAFAWHYSHFHPQNGVPFKDVFYFSYNYGYSMVEVFFLISGFGIMTGYSKRIFTRTISFIDFIITRIKKLYPSFIFSTVITLLLECVYIRLSGETFVYPNLDLYHLFLNVFLLQNGYFGTEWSFNSPTWCVSILMICCMIYFFIIWYAKNERYIYYYSYVLFIIGLSLLIIRPELPIVNSLVGRGLASFSVGVLLFGLFNLKDRIDQTKVGYFSLFVLVAAYYIIRCHPKYIGGITTSMIIGIAPALVLSAIFVPWLNKLLSIRLLTYLGRISMIIYFIHFPVQCMIQIVNIFLKLNLDYSSVPVWCFYVCIVIIFASLYTQYLQDKVERLVLNFFKNKNE